VRSRSRPAATKKAKKKMEQRWIAKKEQHFQTRCQKRKAILDAIVDELNQKPKKNRFRHKTKTGLDKASNCAFTGFR
jgi:hypothetical protein